MNKCLINLNHFYTLTDYCINSGSSFQINIYYFLTIIARVSVKLMFNSLMIINNIDFCNKKKIFLPINHFQIFGRVKNFAIVQQQYYD